MILARPILSAAIVLGLAGPLAAQESGGFVVRLGRDTTAVETFARTGGRIVVDQVGRAPRVLQRHLEYDLGADGATARVVLTITSPLAPAGAPPVQQVEATFAGDSLRVETRRDTSVSRVGLALPAGLVAIAGSSPWSMYEALSMRLAHQKADSLRLPMYLVGASSVSWVAVRRLGRDSIDIQNENDRFHARVDRAGHLLHVVPIHGTGQYTVDRIAALDLPGMVASFAARERQGGAMGALSIRDTVRASVGGATLWIDYGRPAKRGRTVFGGVVPWGELWRTGANAATQFRTDKDLEIGGQVVPAGFYTLWTIPSPGGWKLIVNGETGQWGTAHKAERDLYTVDIKAGALPESVERFTIGVESAPEGGVLHLDWDTTRASIPFTVKP
jgi:hypothetical protein